jgi:hypothetical protein
MASAFFISFPGDSWPVAAPGGVWPAVGGDYRKKEIYQSACDFSATAFANLLG